MLLLLFLLNNVFPLVVLLMGGDLGFTASINPCSIVVRHFQPQYMVLLVFFTGSSHVLLL